MRERYQISARELPGYLGSTGVQNRLRSDYRTLMQLGIGSEAAFSFIMDKWELTEEMRKYVKDKVLNNPDFK